MKTRDYENHVQVVGFLQDHVRVKLVTEAGEEIGGVANCIEVPIGKIPIQRRTTANALDFAGRRLSHQRMTQRRIFGAHSIQLSRF